MGLSSALHCLAMCGGIIGALSMSLKKEVRDSQWNLVSYVFAYNLGRISSYVLAGFVIGTLGQTIFTAISPQYGHTILRVAAGLFMVGMGLYLAGWFPKFAAVERLGVPLWKVIEPVSKRFIPARTRLHALIFGAIWGWLPCGLVYSALIMTASSGGSAQGALFMLAFGAGTLPVALATGVMTGRILNFARTPYVKQIAGIMIIMLGLMSLFYTGERYWGEVFSSGHH